MKEPGPVLVLAAAPIEIAALEELTAKRRGERLEIRVTGVGKVAAALGAEQALAELSPSWVLQLGCAGAYPSSQLAVGDVAIAVEEIFGDEGFETPDGFTTMDRVGFPLAERPDGSIHNRVPVDAPSAGVLAALEKRFTPSFRVACGPLLTVSTGSGTDELARRMEERWDHPVVESMEGAASALVAWRRGTRFSEIRGVSNPVGNRGQGTWDIETACRNAAEVLLAWVDLETARNSRASGDSR